MVDFSTANNQQFSQASQIRHNLKQAIAASSGFKSWQLEQLYLNNQLKNLSLDYQVYRYLRETLETLAY